MEVNNLLTEDLIKLELESDNKDGVIKELVDILAQEDKLTNKEEFIEVILDREDNISTGLGKGIAIPHGRSDVVKEASIVFAKSKQGIDFSSLDGKVTKLFFMIAVPKEADKDHLKIISQLSKKLADSSLRKNLLAANNKKEIIKIIAEQ